MTTSSLLSGKRALVFGAGGSVGSAVAREFAQEGAEVFLSGRTQSHVEEVARQISSSGGVAHAATLDALDEGAVAAYAETLIHQHGPVDIVFNATGPLASDYGNGKQAIDLPVEQFMVPLTSMVKSQFITARTLLRHMVERRSGVIIFLTGSPARGHVAGASAIGTAFGALETLTENLAVEVGQAGVRVVCLRTTANVDSRTIRETMDAIAAQVNATREQMIARMAGHNFLKIPATTQDTARAAAFIASDRARMFTGTVVNASAGAALD